jgi:hypothetical protein
MAIKGKMKKKIRNSQNSTWNMARNTENGGK